MTVEEATEVTPDLVEAIGRLLPHLSKSAPAPSEADVKELVSSPATVLLMARDDDGAYVGTLTLALFRIPSGVRAWIEDVIVDPATERQGIGSALTRVAIERARAAGARTVDLTSRPSREAANRMYVRLGFAPRETNVYRFEQEDEEEEES